MAGPRLLQEFPDRDREYYRQALEQGRLHVETADGRAVAAGMALRESMVTRHIVHRHEPPVPTGPIQVGTVVKSPPRLCSVPGGSTSLHSWTLLECTCSRLCE
jgi:hypothetical protein